MCRHIEREAGLPCQPYGWREGGTGIACVVMAGSRASALRFASLTTCRRLKPLAWREIATASAVCGSWRADGRSSPKPGGRTPPSITLLSFESRELVASANCLTDWSQSCLSLLRWRVGERPQRQPPTAIGGHRRGLGGGAGRLRRHPILSAITKTFLS